MTPLDAIWHILNGLAAPFWVSVLTTIGAKLSWRRESAHRGLMGLLPWAYGPALAAHALTWAYFGAEGSMLGHALMITAAALGLWLRLFLMPTR